MSRLSTACLRAGLRTWQAKSAAADVNTSSLLTVCMHAQASDNPLEDAKYACNVSEELAHRLAHSAQPRMRLSEYLLYV